MQNTADPKQSPVKGVYPWGSSWPPPKGAGNYDPDLRVERFSALSPVASFASNAFGLFDMGGNVAEWCGDVVGVRTWKNVVALSDTWDRIARGGSWVSDQAGQLLSSHREGYDFEFKGATVGFRCVLVVGSPANEAVSPVATSTTIGASPSGSHSGNPPQSTTTAGDATLLRSTRTPAPPSPPVPGSSAIPSPSATLPEAEVDAQLNAAYTALRKTMKEAEKQKLKREQIEWLKRRDAMSEPTARVRFIQERTAELKQRAAKSR